MNTNSHFSILGLPSWYFTLSLENHVSRQNLLYQRLIRGFWFNSAPTVNGVLEEASNSTSTVSEALSTRHGSQNNTPQRFSWTYPDFYTQVTPLILSFRHLVFPEIPRNFLFPEETFASAHQVEHTFCNENVSDNQTEEEVSSSVEPNNFQAANFTFPPYGQIGQQFRRDTRREINRDTPGENISFDQDHSMDWQDSHIIRHSLPPEEPFELRPPHVFEDNSTTGTLVPECLNHGIFVFYPSRRSFLSEMLDGSRVIVMNPWNFPGATMCTCTFLRANGPLQRNLEIADQAFVNSFPGNYLTAENGFPIRDLTSQVGPLNLSANRPVSSRIDLTAESEEESEESTQSEEELEESTQSEVVHEQPTQSQAVSVIVSSTSHNRKKTGHPSK